VAAVLSEAGYGRLLREVGALIEQGKSEAEAKAGHILAVTYWKVGERIGREQLTERAGYGEGVMARLADELGIARTSLVRATAFARAYAQPPPPGLSWAHYRELLAVTDPKARAFYETTALARRWTSRELRTQIGAHAFQAGGPVAPGPLKRPSDGNYVYRCEVTHVIDGDTLIAHVDLGFEVIKAQRLRLKGVDAPKAKTTAGNEATRWVQQTLARAQQVVVKTVRMELHGRYVAHVFYSGDPEASVEEVFRRGTYLNAEVIGEGLAKAGQ
jgi:endonuclease YncB( thermonuclease family)